MVSDWEYMIVAYITVVLRADWFNTLIKALQANHFAAACKFSCRVFQCNSVDHSDPRYNQLLSFYLCIARTVFLGPQR